MQQEIVKLVVNKPLQALRNEFHAASQTPSKGRFASAINGAVLGYCQGLFARSGSPAIHTRNVASYLQEINAPYALSHELFWDYRRNESPSQFVQKAIIPLLGTGKVPILITGLDPAADGEEIGGIVGTSPYVMPGDSILVRLHLGSRESIAPAANLIRSLYAESVKNGRMPLWWPLFQAELGASGWLELKRELGNLWRFVNMAVTPFTEERIFTEFRDNVTVAQFLVGDAEGISEDGTITVSSRGCVGLKSDSSTYDIFGYSKMIAYNSIVPTSIICGPSKPEGTVQLNKARLEAFIDLFKRASPIFLENALEPQKAAVF